MNKANASRNEMPTGHCVPRYEIAKAKSKKRPLGDVSGDARMAHSAMQNHQKISALYGAAADATAATDPKESARLRTLQQAHAQAAGESQTKRDAANSELGGRLTFKAISAEDIQNQKADAKVHAPGCGGPELQKPSSTETQRQFMGAELGRLRAGEPTETDMSEDQLEDFAPKPVVPAKKAATEAWEQKHFGKREFSDKQRNKLADSGAAMPDGSYPIVNTGDLSNAVQAFGRSPDAKTKAHITSRAKALNATHLLPAHWEGSTKEEEKCAAAPVSARKAAWDQRHSQVASTMLCADQSVLVDKAMQEAVGFLLKGGPGSGPHPSGTVG